MKNIEIAAEEAEVLGWAKYKTNSGQVMVIISQNELNDLIKQSIESDLATKNDGSVCA